MNNYRFLNLPAQPLKDGTMFDNIVIQGYNTYDAVDILNSNVLEILYQANLTPTFCAVFSQNNFSCDQDGKNSVAHSDITRISENQWKPIVCGVNWELNQNKNKFYWLDTGSLPEHYPQPNTLGYIQKQRQYDLLAGISYGPHRRMPGFIEGSTILEEVELIQPTLIRTDIPHLVTYHSPNKIRYSLSVRFKETWTTWNEALTAFDSIVCK